jgi:hypothetical protein
MTTTAKVITAAVIPASVVLAVAAVRLNYRRNRSRAADTARLDDVLRSSQPALGTKKDIRLTPKQIQRNHVMHFPSEALEALQALLQISLHLRPRYPAMSIRKNVEGAQRRRYLSGALSKATR